MKSRMLLMALLAGIPWIAMAQSNDDDDLYYVPKKETKTEKKKVESYPVKTQTSKTTVYAAPGSTVVVKDASGKVRDIDEYNRRYSARDNEFKMENDTLYIEEKPYSERGEWVNGFDGSQDDYEYAMRIVRFRNPRYAIPVSSPLYWDVVYGAYPSWDWNVFDDGLYAYVFPTSTNPMWWDWRWNWSFGSHWGFGWGWSSPYYYSSWYSPYWHGYHWGGYDPFWHYGWGGGPHYGWAGGPHHDAWGGGFRAGYTDYRPSRYAQSPDNRRGSIGGGDNYSRFNRRPGGSQTYGDNSRTYGGSSRSNYQGRVVNPDNQNGASSVRQSGVNSSFSRGHVGGESSVGSSSRSTVTRSGSTGTYVRPSSVTDRSGSSYNRPSSTRRSVNYDNDRSTSRSGSYGSGSSYSGGGFSRGGSSSMGGGSGFSRGGSIGGGGSHGSMGGGGGSSRRR